MTLMFTYYNFLSLKGVIQMKQKNIVLFLMGILFLFTLCACSEKQPTSPNNATKTYVIGLDDTFAPMGFRDSSGELVGFDIDLAKEIALRKNFAITFQSIDWAMKETELNAKNIDMIWNGYSISEERKQKVAFSNPYVEDKQLIITLKDSPIKSVNDLKDKTISLQAESTAIDAVNNHSTLSSIVAKIIEYPSNNEVFQDLQTGRCDAVVVDEILARYYMKQNSSQEFRILEESLATEYMAVGVRKQDTELLQAINDGLEELKHDGTYDTIKQKWFSN